MKAVIKFKDRNGGTYTVTKTFNDIRHLENYIAKVDGQNGCKYIDYDVIK